MYTVESLVRQNPSLDTGCGIEQSDVDHVNHLVRLIESSRGENPCSGDLVEHTDEYGTYHPKAHINAELDRLGRFSIYGCPHTPFVFLSVDNQSVHFSAGGGPEAFLDPAVLRHIGKREKQFHLFRSHGAKPDSIYFSAKVNAWEYIAPGQKYPGYSTKGWDRQYICYCEKPADGSAYHYYGQDIAFRNAAEYSLWKKTYRAVEFPVEYPDHYVLFLYRETEKLVSREEWDALSLPVDTRFCNGVVFVKAAYDNGNHMITTYRYTNSGFPETERLAPFKRAKGAALTVPSFICPCGKSCGHCEHNAECPYVFR